MLGEETSILFLFGKVLVRAQANLIGSPSVPADGANRSTSSKNKIGTGRNERPPGELAPAKERNPPENRFRKIVFCESLLFASATLPRKTGQASSITDKRSLEKSCAICTLGTTHSIEAGARSMK